MSSAIPTAASVSESAVIDAPLSQVWHLIKLQDFSKFWSKLDKSEWIKGASPDTDLVKWTFKDGTVLDVKQEEHSVSPNMIPCLHYSTRVATDNSKLCLQTINHYITYSVITASPELTYTSVLSTIRLYPITSGKHEGSTFVTWSGNFSSDADAGVIEDAKFKRREALADLAAAVSK